MNKSLGHRTHTFIGLLLLILVATGCFGPNPVVRSVDTEFPQPGSGQPAIVDAVIANTGPGSGQVEVRVSLTNKVTGVTLQESSTDLELQKDEVTHVIFELDLPPSADNLRSEDIEVQVEAEYPIQ